MVALIVAVGWYPEALTAGVPAQSHGNPRLPAWPMGSPTPELDLVATAGGRKSLLDFRGRVVVVFFGYVRCPDVCPAELFKLALVKKKLGSLGHRVAVVFVTLDPQRDSPKVLDAYLAAFGKDFVALTGTSAQIDRAAANFFVQYARVASGDGYSIDHSASTFVFDRRGHLRVIGSMASSIDDLTHDLGVLAAE